MKVSNIQTIKKAINNEWIDFKMLSKILEVPLKTATSRYYRNNVEAVLLMSKIVKGKERIINNLKINYGTSSKAN